LEDQFRTLVAPKRQGDTRRVFIKLRRYSGTMKPQLVWSMTTGRQVSTPMVLEPSDLFGREGKPL
jgi:hypothetical protein